MKSLNFATINVGLSGLMITVLSKPLRSIADTFLVQDPTLPSLITAQKSAVQICASASEPGIIVLDYGYNVEGIPAFEVIDRGGDTSTFEITYAESRASLNNYMSDGPLPLAAAMDTYRVNHYNISTIGKVTNRLVQGAFRYQKLNLSSKGWLTLQNLGVEPTVRVTPLAELPGSFESSDSVMNAIWTTGARTLQLTEIPRDSVPEFWQVGHEGSLVESIAPQVASSITAVSATAYSLDFQVQPLIGGFGFTVLSNTLNSGIYISVDVSDMTIAAHVGSTSEDPVLAQTSLPGAANISLQAWQSVQVQVALAEISVTINGIQVLNFTQDHRLYGSYGLGASYGHQAMFKDLVVTSPDNSVTYSHPLNDTSFLPDFLMGTNPYDISVDGSRRDRIAYAGDLDVAGSTSLASTHGLEFILGTLDLLGSFQAAPGFFLPTAKIQQLPLETPLDVNITGLLGYSWNLLTAVAHTYMHTGDQAFAQKWAPKVTKMLDWSHSQVLPNGLFNLSDISLGGDWNYYDPPLAGIVTKFNMLYAYALQECDPLLAAANLDVSVYQRRLIALREAIDSQLWSDRLGAYYLSDNIREGFGQDSNAIAILAGVNLNTTHTSERILSRLFTGLAAPGGLLAFSEGALQAGFKRLMSPYASAYHLRAAFYSQNADTARELLVSLWGPMADHTNTNYTGCFWETLDEFGRPGLGLATSLCHGWAAGPTAELSRHVLGAQAVQPGWIKWAISPKTMGLSSAKGDIPTPLGVLSVSWMFSGGLVRMNVTAPGGTQGKITVPEPLLIPGSQSSFLINGVAATGTVFPVEGGKEISILQFSK